MTTHTRGPIAIHERFKEHIGNPECLSKFRPFSYSTLEFQEPVDIAHIDRLGEVFEWDLRSYFERSRDKEPGHIPMLIQEPSKGTVRIKLEASHLRPEKEIPFGD